jgi:hypothetical protein
LASISWEQKFPLVKVRALSRSDSDHNPILTDSGVKADLGNKLKFSFELYWLRQEVFFDLIVKEWNSVLIGSNPMENWLNKLRHVRRFLKGWAKNQSGNYKKEKERLLHIIDQLNLKAKSDPLSLSEREELKKANECINKLRREEESKWAQRAKVKHIQEGAITQNTFI